MFHEEYIFAVDLPPCGATFEYKGTSYVTDNHIYDENGQITEIVCTAFRGANAPGTEIINAHEIVKIICYTEEEFEMLKAQRESNYARDLANLKKRIEQEESKNA